MSNPNVIQVGRAEWEASLAETMRIFGPKNAEALAKLDMVIHHSTDLGKCYDQLKGTPGLSEQDALDQAMTEEMAKVQIEP